MGITCKRFQKAPSDYLLDADSPAMNKYAVDVAFAMALYHDESDEKGKGKKKGRNAPVIDNADDFLKMVK